MSTINFAKVTEGKSRLLRGVVDPDMSESKRYVGTTFGLIYSRSSFEMTLRPSVSSEVL